MFFSLLYDLYDLYDLSPIYFLEMSIASDTQSHA